jgi:prepilin-type N-terminal cleavage/methylation domain-containing protein
MKKKGFTLMEVMIVVVIIIILATLVTVMWTRAKTNAKLSSTTAGLLEINTAVTQYAEDNNYQYPADVSRGVPPGLEKYLQGGVWPTSSWPHGVYDWDSWTHPGPDSALLGQQIYQISYRLCGVNDPDSYCQDPVLFPHFTHYSSIYYCISGPCIPHPSDINAPAYCVNCAIKPQNPPL